MTQFSLIKTSCMLCNISDNLDLKLGGLQAVLGLWRRSFLWMMSAVEMTGSQQYRIAPTNSSIIVNIMKLQGWNVVTHCSSLQLSLPLNLLQNLLQNLPLNRPRQFPYRLVPMDGRNSREIVINLFLGRRLGQMQIETARKGRYRRGYQ